MVLNSTFEAICVLGVREDLQVSLVVRQSVHALTFSCLLLFVAKKSHFYAAINACIGLHESIRIHRHWPLLLLVPRSCIPNAVEPDKEENLTGHF